MTHFLALLNVVSATSTKKSSSNPAFLIILVVIAVGGYFFFLRPQQAKARAARAGVGAAGYQVGDEVQTIGGVVGTILEIHGDRYTLLTGNVGSDGNLNGAQPTRIVFVRQAIARKLEPVVEPDPIDHVDVDVDDGHEFHHDSAEIDDHDEEAEEA
jgi:preprotein translocase YajC subunit